MRLLLRLRPALHDLNDMLAEAAAGHGAPAGTLRINAIQTAAHWLTRHVVPLFLDRYPHVTLELISDNRFVDIVANGFDAGVRLEEAVPQDMIAVRFGGRVRFVTVAAPSYLAQHGEPATPDDLLRHRCIRQRLASGKLYRWEYGSGADEIAVDVPGVLTLDDNEVMVEAAVAGLGIAYLPERTASAAIAAGWIKPVLEAWSPPIGGFCLYYPGQRHVPRPLRAFIDMLRSGNSREKQSSS